jgi:hypothetical protein
VTVKSQDIGDSWLVRLAVVPAERILDQEGALVESAQAERAEMDIPFAIVDLHESDVLLTKGLTNVDPVLVPADPAVPTLFGRRHDRPQLMRRLLGRTRSLARDSFRLD